MLKTIAMDLNERLATAEEMLQFSLEQQTKQGDHGQERQDDLDDLDKRVSNTEEHSTLDKLNLSADLETKLNSLQWMPKVCRSRYRMASLAWQMALLSPRLPWPLDPLPPPEDPDIDNNTIFDTRIRLDMKARPANSLSFEGRLSANKVFAILPG